MRSALTLLTSLLLSTAVQAQTIAPEFQSRDRLYALAPSVDLPVAGTSTLAQPTAGQLAPIEPSLGAAPVAGLTPAPAVAPVATPPADAPVTRLVPQRTPAPKAARAAVERPAQAYSSPPRDPAPRRLVERYEAPRAYYRASGPAPRRDLGRFWPPVF